MIENLNFQPVEFVKNLWIMGEGMLCIFAVIGAIALITTLLNKIFSRKKKVKE